MDHDEISHLVHHWVKDLVVGLNLCPFVKRELARHSVRYRVTEAMTEQQLLLVLQTELKLLEVDATIETTLLIHPRVLQDFHDYNRFLDDADSQIEHLGLDGVYQIASFHPDYCFYGMKPGNVKNFTNKSPYPLLHLIREESLERAIGGYPDVHLIHKRNAALMKKLGLEKVSALLQASRDKCTRL